jgi:predicted restriction endonuclease
LSSLDIFLTFDDILNISMEEFLYILAGVAYLGYSIYSAGQKQKKKKQEQEVRAHVQAGVEDMPIQETPKQSIFDEILGLQNFEEQIQEDFSGEHEYEEALDSIPEEEGEPTTYTKSRSMNESKIQTSIIPIENNILEDNDFEDEEVTDFNLRNAVISAEILNPPYINR